MKKYKNKNVKHSNQSSGVKWVKRIKWIILPLVAISIFWILFCQAPLKQIEKSDFSTTPVSLSFVISDCMLK